MKMQDKLASAVIISAAVIFLFTCRLDAVSSKIDVMDHGAAADGETCDADAIAAALAAGLGGTVVFPPGTYLIASTIDFTLTNDLTLRGTPGATELLFSGGGGQSRSLVFRSTSVGDRRELQADAERGGSVLKFADVGGIQQGDLVSVGESTAAELSWRYPKAHLSYVSAVDPEAGTVSIAHPLNFTFSAEAGATVTVSRPAGRLRIEGFDCLVGDSDRSARALVELRSLQEASASGLRFLGLMDFSHRGMAVSGCLDASFVDIYFDKIQYGFLINNSRDSYFTNIESYNTSHPVTVGSWSDGVYVDGLTGYNNQGIVESHPAFNVHYNNVMASMEAGRSASNLRSVGGSIRNSVFISRGTGNYFQTVKLASPEIYEDYTFEMENVLWRGAGPVLVRNVGKAVFRNVRCQDLQGNEMGVEVGAGVGKVVLVDTVPGRSLSPYYRFIAGRYWSSVGPFSCDIGEPHERAKNALAHVYAPERDYLAAELSLQDSYETADGETLAWQHDDAGETDKRLMEAYIDMYETEGLNLTRRHGFPSAGISYALTSIYSPAGRSAELFAGVDYWAKGWINGREIVSDRPREDAEADGAEFRGGARMRAEISLDEGWNTLLLKIRGGGGGVNFTALISDPGGDLVFSPEKRR